MTTDTEVVLNEEQAAVLQWLEAGHNIFITGVAGTGKTFLLDYWLTNLPNERRVGIAASTGIAATHIGGGTLHSWLGAGPDHDTPERLCHAKWYEKHAPRIRSVDTLVIDEISMVDGRMFTLAEVAHRRAFENNKPWGGIQLILVGDLGQLPPVEEQEKGWCFQSPSWGPSNITMLELTKVMRQGDQRFADMLRRIRVGNLDDEVFNILSDRLGAYDPEEQQAVRLMTHNWQADQVNDERLARIKGKEHVYKAHDIGQHKHLNQLKRSCLSPELLKLKVGARVMFTRNSTLGGWVNGTLGVIESLGDDSVEVRIGGEKGRVVEVCRETWEKKEWQAEEDHPVLVTLASRSQIPLRLAWAITIHKSQGMTIDKVSVNLENTFAPGQAYVALSRCRSLEGLNIESWRGLSSIVVHPLIQANR